MLAFMKSASRSRTAGHKVAEIKGQIADKISSAIMMVDRDFTVTYVNEPTRELLKKNEVAFRSIWPSFDADKIIGTCIDVFHKNPLHQHQILADPSRVPIRTEITIGNLKVALLVNGAFDAKNNHVGNILEWRDVTVERSNADMLDAINKAQAVIEFSVDGKIQHANENFLQALGYTLDEIKGQHHSMLRRSGLPAKPGIPRCSGKNSGAENTTPASTSELPRAAAKSGSRRATTRSSTPTARPSRS